jgi:hypothetical protein
MATAWERRPPDHVLVSNDSGTPIVHQLTDVNGAVVDLTGASAIKYMLWIPGAASAAVNAAMTVVGAATNGTVSYTPTALQSAIAADYLEEIEVTYSGGLKQTFPALGPHKVRIRQDLVA